MDLENRTLLLMGGGAYAKDIKRYKDEKHFRIVAVGRDSNTAISQIADSFYQVDTQDVDAVINIVKQENVDGIFVGASEINIAPAIKVAEETGVYFYVGKKQWDILANKQEFKNQCRKYGIPVVPEYEIPENYTSSDVAKLPFPILLKPVDSSGARGMNACYSLEEFDSLYKEALRWSQSKKVLVEKLITKADETFFQYTLQDGECSLTSCFTKVFVNTKDEKLILPLFHMYPSKHINEYFDKVDSAVKRFCKDLGIHNGVMTLQSFYKDGEFYFFEAGFRMGGAQNYIFSNFQNGTNSLEYMINYALTGNMCDQKIIELDNPRFPYPCCNYYVGLTCGTIAEINGLEEVKQMPFVLNVTEMANVGDVILDTNALERICLRIHVIGRSKAELAENLVQISKTLKIVSTEGFEMQLEHLVYDRCLNAIENAIL